jgi:hypothetical protein
VVFPQDIDISEAHQLQFSSLKFREKQSLSQKATNPLDAQFHFLWSQLNLKRRQSNKSGLRTNPKIIYVFEYCPSRTSLQNLATLSRNYLPPVTLNSLPGALSSDQFFNLTDIVGLRLYQTSLGQTTFVFLARTDEEEWSLQQIHHLHSPTQFVDYSIPQKLTSNYAVFPLQLTNIHVSSLNQLTACASFSTVALATLTQPEIHACKSNYYNHGNVANYIIRFRFQNF